MKTVTLFILISSFSLIHYNIFSQDSNPEVTINDILTNSTKATEKMLFIYDLDVFNYYELSDFDTDLKKQVFKKTQEYQNKLTEINSIKSKMLTSTYYLFFPNAFKSINQGMDKEVNYDVKRKGFNINLGTTFDLDRGSRRPLKFYYFKPYYEEQGNQDHYYGIIIKALPTEYIEATKLGYKYEKLFIPINEEFGLEIENNKENIGVYLFFKPTGKEDCIFSEEKYTGGWSNKIVKNLKSDKVRVIVADIINGKIYFDKNYSYQVQSKKH